MKTFTASEAFLARAEKVIPLGSQTFSKSRTQYPMGVSPYFVTRAEGSRCWDLDGNGTPVLVTGGFHAYPPYTQMSRVMLWRRR